MAWVDWFLGVSGHFIGQMLDNSLCSGTPCMSVCVGAKQTDFVQRYNHQNTFHYLGLLWTLFFSFLLSCRVPGCSCFPDRSCAMAMPELNVARWSQCISKVLLPEGAQGVMQLRHLPGIQFRLHISHSSLLQVSGSILA